MTLSKLKQLVHFYHSSRRSIVISTEVVVGILVCVLSLLIFALLTREMLEKDFTNFDIQFSQFIYTLRTPLLTIVMKIIAELGSSILLIIATLLVIILLVRKHQKEAVVFCIALIIGAILNTSFKMMIQRQRPQMSPLVIEDSYSFPSGHAMNSSIFYGLISYFSYHFFRNKKISIMITIASAIVVLLIGFSRIYLGVHFLTDVLAGYVIGFWWFVTILLIDHALIFYHLFKRENRYS
jgi:membrane-associated phospholipid phosphatase